MDYYIEMKPLLDFPNTSWYYNFFSFPFAKLQLKDEEVEEMVTSQKRSQFKKNRKFILRRSLSECNSPTLQHKTSLQ